MARFLLLLMSLILPAVVAEGADKPAVAAKDDKTPSVEELAKKVRPSIVAITVRGRDGRQEGMGTGFVVSADGLIATNRHVLGEGRPLRVETADGMSHDVKAVHAADRKLDLAILRIDAKGLKPLELGDSTTLKDGQAVMAVGNPQGLRHSVVTGVVSSMRTIEGRPMIQVAIPIEPGNSGSPLLDMHGRVYGILTIKSLVTPNLGFAVAINALKPLLKNPSPVPMSAWLTIGALDREEWQVKFEGQWRQRAGRIIAEGQGRGFGGRSLCLSRRQLPALPCEIAVRVRLDDESGAAGLIFHADGDDKHYGFYPSAGKLRLTRFDGPDVFTWKVLEQKDSKYYRPGEWNTLKVRLEKDCIRCFVNDHLVIELTDDVYTAGRVGLAKFRDTVAEFKHFQIAKEIPSLSASADAVARVSKALDGLPAKKRPRAAIAERLAPEGAAGMQVLRERAQRLEEQAAELRRLAAAVHERNVLTELKRVLDGKEENIDLLHAALLIARLDNEDVDVDGYRREVERMAERIAARLPKKADDKTRLAALGKYLFEERGFHGSRGDYYNRSNSYLSEVIDDREGIPITLSVLYIELGRRLGVHLEGVGLPGHFVVRHVAAKREGQLIDVYEGGQPLSREEAEKKVRDITERRLRDKDLAAVNKRSIIVRMLQNLLNVAEREKEAASMLRYLNAIIAVAPDAAQHRGMRAVLRHKAGDRDGALQDADWLLEHPPEGLNVEALQEFRRLLTRPEK
ncbi:MAG TPA: transglutaminase family protein [Gemmataceae bacterium]|nr:transglutaminase family protein [Gemmataceae bacterium]